MKDIVVVTPFSSMSEVTRRLVSESGYSNVDLLEAERGNIERTRPLQNGLQIAVTWSGYKQ